MIRQRTRSSLQNSRCTRRPARAVGELSRVRLLCGLVRRFVSPVRVARRVVQYPHAMRAFQRHCAAGSGPHGSPVGAGRVELVARPLAGRPASGDLAGGASGQRRPRAQRGRAQRASSTQHASCFQERGPGRDRGIVWPGGHGRPSMCVRSRVRCARPPGPAGGQGTVPTPMRALREERGALGLACGIGRLAGWAGPSPCRTPGGQGTELPMGTGDGDDPRLGSPANRARWWGCRTVDPRSPADYRGSGWGWTPGPDCRRVPSSYT
jgi:hypothetical protein